MKKGKFAILLAAFVAAGSAGCSKKNEESKSEEVPKQEARPSLENLMLYPTEIYSAYSAADKGKDVFGLGYLYRVEDDGVVLTSTPSTGPKRLDKLLRVRIREAELGHVAKNRQSWSEDPDIDYALVFGKLECFDGGDCVISDASFRKVKLADQVEQRKKEAPQRQALGLTAVDAAEKPDVAKGLRCALGRDGPKASALFPSVEAALAYKEALRADSSVLLQEAAAVMQKYNIPEMRRGDKCEVLDFVDNGLTQVTVTSGAYSD